jgi:hypothetical protein
MKEFIQITLKQIILGMAKAAGVILGALIMYMLIKGFQ